MKRILIALLLLVTCQMAFCQSASSIFNDFRDKKHAEYVTVPKLLMTVAAAKVKDGNVAALLKEVDEARVLTLSDCSKSIRKKFLKKIAELSKNGYSEFTGMKKDKYAGMTVLVKETGNTISEIVATTSSDNSCVGILISGTINAEDVAAIIGMVDD